MFSVCHAVFGVSLQTAVYRSQLGTDGIELPTVFRECIDYLEENGKYMYFLRVYLFPGVWGEGSSGLRIRCLD